MDGYSLRVWIAFLTLLRREIKRFFRIWVQTLIPPAISMGLYLLIFGGLIGSRVGEISGVAYVEYITPGIILMSIINSSYANVSSSFFSAKFQKHIEELIVSPIPDVVILVGYISGGVVRGLLVGVVVTLVAFLFSGVVPSNPLPALAVACLTALLFSLAGMVNGMLANDFDDISIIPTIVLTPLTYLGGVFFSVSLLPDPWEGMSRFNPILYMVNTFRYSMIGVSDVHVPSALIIMVATLVALTVLVLYMMKRGTGYRH